MPYFPYLFINIVYQKTLSPWYLGSSQHSCANIFIKFNFLKIWYYVLWNETSNIKLNLSPYFPQYRFIETVPFHYLQNKINNKTMYIACFHVPFILISLAFKKKINAPFWKDRHSLWINLTLHCLLDMLKI